MLRFISSLVNVLKLPVKVLCGAVLLVSLFFFVSPATLLEKMDLFEFKENYGTYISFALLISSSILFIYLVKLLYHIVGAVINHNRHKKRLKVILGNEKSEEGQLAWGLYNDKKHEAWLTYNSREVVLLSNAEIISPLGNELIAGNNGELLRRFALNPWVMEYIDIHYK